MEPKKTKKDNKILEAFESIQSENQRLQTILRDIMIKRKQLEANADSAENQLFSLIEKDHAVQGENDIICMKLQTIQEEVSACEEEEKKLAEDINNVTENIKEFTDASDNKTDELTAEVDRLSSHFLFFLTKNEEVQNECLKSTEDFEKLKIQISEKENRLLDMKRKLDDSVYYPSPENPLELVIEESDRKLVMESMEEELLNYRKQLEELNVVKQEKILSEYEAVQNF